MKLLILTGMVCLSTLAIAQEITFDYDRAANFSAFKTYQWVDAKAGRASNDLMDQNIQRSIDAQLALKGLQRVESGADLQISYQAAIDKEKQFETWNTGPRWFGNGRVTSSTIEVGRLVVNIVESANQHLVWRGSAEKTLDIKKDPEKNYQNLQKAMAKLFKNYPPAAGRD